MATHFTAPGQQFLDVNGNPYSGGKLYFYVAATTTPQNVFSDATLVTPLSNPVILDSAGRAVQIFVSATTYRVQLKTSADVLVADWDNVDSGLGVGTNVVAVANGGTGATTATLARANLGIGSSGALNTGTAAGQIPLLGASGEISPIIEAATIVALTEDTSPDLTNDFITTYDASALTVKKVHPSRFGKLAQVVSSKDGAMATGTTIIPFDSTIPQNTEGDQYLSLAITPQSATSTLYITVNIQLAHTVLGNLGAGIFQDTTANALAFAAVYNDTINLPRQVNLAYAMTSGTTSATTFKVRAGSSVAGTTTFNGTAGASRYGGVLFSSITITEVLP